MLTPIEDFENQLLLSTFSLASHALRLLGQAGQLDHRAKRVIRTHLHLLEAKIVAMPHQEDRDFLHGYLDNLIAVLPPTSGDG